MAKKMLINALHPEESRVAIVDENGRLVDLDIEITGSEQMRGNIYKGVVLRVEPSLQAAFIDIGLKKPAFLQMGELHPDSWQWREDVPEDQRKKRPRIHEVLRRGQELLVQVEKDERDMKGAAVTSYISLPGRYMVLMPGSDSAGISRKVEGEGERRKLKDMVKEMTMPEGIGYIIRTEAVGRTLEELQKDLDSLVARYNEIVAIGKETSGAVLVYKEHAVVIRMIRDYFSADIDEVLVDSKEVCKEAKAFFREVMPKLEKRVKMHQEKRPIFSRYQIEEQIDQIYEKKVLLKSGGSLIIEPTEALVSVDVNSGKSTGERNVEETAFRTNIEAVEEAARQLRLRDLGGLIVLDLIDMREMKHVKEVEKALKAALKSDKARVTVGRISQFGMLEMSRQRIKQNLEQGSILDCPHCSGRGKVKGVESMALSFLRKVHAAAAKGMAAEVRGALPLEVAYYLLNRNKRELAQIENDYDIEVTIKGKPSFLMNQLELEIVKREKPLAGELPPAEVKVPKVKAAPLLLVPAAEPDELDEPAGIEESAEATEEEMLPKKKRSRSRKKKSEADVAEVLPPGQVEQVTEESAAEDEPEAQEGSVAEELQEPGKKKRKRRRKKKVKTVEVAAVEGEAVAPAAEVPAESQQVHEESGEADAGEPALRKKKRRRRKRGGAKSSGETDAAVTLAPSAEPEHRLEETFEEIANEALPAKKRSTRKKPQPSAEAAPPMSEPEQDVALPVLSPKDDLPLKSRRAPVKKKRAAEPPAEAMPEVPSVPEPAVDPPKAKRAPRRKKAAPEESK